MKRFALVGLASVAATMALADVGAIKARQKIFEGWSDATKPVAGMLRGQQAFSLPTVQTSLKAYIDGAEKLQALFPDDSKTGEKTEALPAIWEKKQDFTGLLAKFGSDSQAALAAIKDEASLKAEMPKVLGACKNCHDQYRAKKS